MSALIVRHFPFHRQRRQSFQGFYRLSVRNTRAGGVQHRYLANVASSIESSRADVWKVPGECGSSFSTYLLEFGVTDWLTFGTYEDFLAGAGQTYSYYQTRAITTRIRFPKIPDFIDPAMQIEYWLPAAGANEESLLDVILIGEKKIGNFILDINMSYLFETANPSGPTASLPPDFGYAAGLYYLLADWVNTGIEAFGDQGSINNMLPLGGNGQVTQQDYVFSSWNFAIGENIDWNIGIGAGLTANSAPFAIKTIFEYHFNPFKTEHESEKDTEERDIH